MPVYNGEQYLAEAIESILAQTFNNFELIIIDDGSTDASLEVLRVYEKRDSRIRLITRENRNLATTLNDIVSLARGKWLARMDQDDIALPQRFERQLQWLQQTEADITGSWVQRFGTSDRRLVRLRQTDDAIKMELLFCSPFAHPSIMMRTTLIKQLCYDNTWEKVEDYDLWERAARAGWKMTNVPEVLLLYRIHDTQISTKTANSQQQLTQLIRQRYWEFVCYSMDLDPKCVDELMKIFKFSPSSINMDAVDALFTKLLYSRQGESRVIIFDHMTRLYFRVAASNPTVVFRWGRLNRDYGKGLGLSTKFQLMIFSLLRIHVDGVLFRQLKKFHVWKAS
ncbi:glycosyltransferase family 2 protein [Methylotenera sp. L2L1]|uniref:glycosyltransferase family 2 protein n=1 Tax=Methylotenera sp. L2L1 TaxID=1502770 RepID=UPI00068E98B1|nr:glycosyltransferase [Methylotenera sp. L2L1]